MPLNAGSRLGPFEIQSLLGTGGMGEVYRARDTRLDRDVAIKVLREDIAGDAERRARFEREARAVSRLNHPNICTLYDVGRHQGVDYLVVEYLDGHTLADRLQKGALPIDQALSIAVQIAEALDAAHRAGIVHRDLKPANVFLCRDRASAFPTAKLLDFGIARLVVPAPTAGAPTTVTLTGKGTLLGTVQYMAPEQLEGREPDARSDLFAFGAVLYEMLTGRLAFEGESQSNVIAAVLERDPPPLATAQPHVSPALDRLVRKCLAKDPDRRWQTARDLRDELQWQRDVRSETALPRSAHRPWWRGRMAWIGASVLVGALLAALLFGLLGPLNRDADQGGYRLSITLPDGVRLPTDGVAVPPASRFALSPDGRRLAFVASEGTGHRLLWVRALEAPSAQPIAGTDDAECPFWSPDSRYVGFVARHALKKVEISSGSLQTLTDAASCIGAAGAWNRAGFILFTPSLASPLFRIPDSGGPASPVTTLDAANHEVAHTQPFFLPDGRHVLYLALGNPSMLYVGSLDPREKPTPLFASASHAQYANGHLIFLRQGTLMAQPFDADRLRLGGEPMPIAERVEIAGNVAAGAFSVSERNALAYRTVSPEARSQLVWFDRDGRRLTALGEAASLVGFALSPDGTRVAATVVDPERNMLDIWIYDVEHGVRTRLTSDPANHLSPVWSPDGREVVYSSTRKGRLDLYRRPSDGRGEEEVSFDRDAVNKYATSWSPDGRTILYFTGGTGSRTRNDLFALLLAEHKATPFVNSIFSEAAGRFSPDGRWIAYGSDETGTHEIYVARFPDAAGRLRVSSSGGVQPQWRRDGRELFYLDPNNRMMSAAMNTRGDLLEVGAVHALFDTQAQNAPFQAFGTSGSYAVSGDGQRFLINTIVENAMPAPITIVLNWTSLLNK